MNDLIDYRRSLLAALLLGLAALDACKPPSPTAPAGMPVTSPEAVTTTQIHLPLVQGQSSSPVSTPVSPISPPPTPTPGAVPTNPPPPTATPLPPPVLKPSFGVQIDPNTQNLAQVFRWVEGIGFGWIKVQVQWAITEQQPEVYRWVELDGLVDLANDFGFQILVGVVDAPGWLRAEPGYNGPPQDVADFERFMEALASRYAGRVTAYELWNEPNLSREWYGATLDPAGYVALLAAGSRGHFATHYFLLRDNAGSAR